VAYLTDSSGWLNVVDVKSREKWTFQTNGRLVSSPAVGDGLVYFGGYDTYVYAIDIATKQPKWKFQTGGEVLSSPAVSGDVVYIGSSDGYLYALK
jgi:eukaryotic-like serine/threonine-protein kinase